MRRPTNIRVSLLSFIGVLLTAAPALAWDFDNDTCAPSAGYEADAIEPPQAMIMLDRSGSMDNPAQTCGGDICRITGTVAGTTFTDYEFVCDDDCDDDADCLAEAEDYLGDYTSNYSITSATHEGWVSCSNVKSLWEAAVDAIDAITFDMTQPSPDDLRFGLGLFHGSTARIEVEAAEDNHSAIMDVLDNESPSGGTPMETAIDTTRLSTTIQSAPTAAAGILVTDGEPTSDRDDTLEAACEHRLDAPLYVVGFGAGTDEPYNNVLAAAGGTGSCANGGDPCASGTNQYDASHWTGQCTGSYQAQNQTEFQNALNQISSQVACTFDISALATNPDDPEWDDPDQGCTNYDCLKIELNGSVNQRIYHTSSTQTPVGWEWASTSHTHIRLLDTADGAADDYCTKLKNGSLSDPDEDDVNITRACMCVEPTGNTCAATDMVPPPDTCECPVGTWTCNQGIDVCSPNDPCVNDNGNAVYRRGAGEECTRGVGECERTGSTFCDGMDLDCDAVPGEPTEEICDGLDNDCGGKVDEPTEDDDATPGGLGFMGLCHMDCVDSSCADEAAMIAAETNRCKIGFSICEDGSGGCVPLDPMPEVCNGLDDDCNGTVDNLSTSWDLVTDENGDPYTLPSEYEQAACYERDVCTCENDDKDDFEGADFPSYLEGWANGGDPPEPTCECGEGLMP